jgi:hypothetical protein
MGFVLERLNWLSTGEEVPDALEEAPRFAIVRLITTSGTGVPVGILVGVLIRGRIITRSSGGGCGCIVSGGGGCGCGRSTITVGSGCCCCCCVL